MSKEFTVEQMQALMKSVAEYKIGELSFESEGMKLKIKGRTEQTQMVSVQAPVQSVPAAQSEPQTAPAAVAGRYITSPIVGTFYGASAPDQEPFVKAGQQIRKGETAFIIESMKVMNEVPADQEGTVVEILVENGAPVEFGQNILRIE